ncbi:hypothetical protein PF008_g8481 [Phytophthora fragariae]|uniref:Uncharacterized protein n=1 Tax=Phytophthora fragariae TaxID=53985 RepID=A0A6G0RZG7_9STRA|nr:hypothetical protein PF008_g8481 [Phytophthora fragariae]
MYVRLLLLYAVLGGDKGVPSHQRVLIACIVEITSFTENVLRLFSMVNYGEKKTDWVLCWILLLGEARLLRDVGCRSIFQPNHSEGLRAASYWRISSYDLALWWRPQQIGNLHP